MNGHGVEAGIWVSDARLCSLCIQLEIGTELTVALISLLNGFYS